MKGGWGWKNLGREVEEKEQYKDDYAQDIVSKVVESDEESV